MTENHKINDEELKDVTGAMIMDTFGTPDYDPTKPRYAVINNNNGQIMDRFPEEWQACEYAKRFGKDDPYNTMRIGYETADRLRKNPNVF